MTIVRNPQKLSGLVQLLGLGLCLSLAGCGTERVTVNVDESIEDAPSQLIVGDIYTMDANQPWVQAVVSEQGRILYAGDEAGAAEWIDAQTQTIRLPKGAMVLPGLHDIHMHPLEQGSDNIDCLVETEADVDAWLADIEVCAQKGSGWVLGYGFSISTLIADGRNPKALLDSISNGRPVMLMEQTSHAGWANSEALRRAGFNAQSINPSGGHIGRSVDKSLNGLLMDTASDMVFHYAFEQDSAGDAEADYQGLLWALKKIRKNGLTSIGNARVYWRRGNLDAWYRAQDAGQLTARSTLALWFYPEYSDDAAQIQEVAALFDQGDDFLRVNEIKLYDDGISINTTAAMLDPYLQDLGFGLASTNGLNYFSENRLANIITQLERQGFRINIHTIGDRGVHEALNAFELSRSANTTAQHKRHRLTHVEFVDPEDYPRFEELNLVADAQVAGEWTTPANHSPEEINLLGAERMADQIPLKGLYEQGATITLSSDWGVSDLNPFVGMQHALSRGKQALPSVHEAIAAYTINAAYALETDDKLGSIEVGKLADFTVIDRNLLAVPVTSIGDAKVLYTIVNGDVVYQK